MAKNVMGVYNYPLYYVIRPDQPAVWVPLNASEQQMYELPHNGAVYKRDNKIVWGKILNSSLNISSW